MGSVATRCSLNRASGGREVGYSRPNPGHLLLRFCACLDRPSPERDAGAFLPSRWASTEIDVTACLLSRLLAQARALRVLRAERTLCTVRRPPHRSSRRRCLVGAQLGREATWAVVFSLRPAPVTYDSAGGRLGGESGVQACTFASPQRATKGVWRTRCPAATQRALLQCLAPLSRPPWTLRATLRGASAGAGRGGGLAAAGRRLGVPSGLRAGSNQFCYLNTLRPVPLCLPSGAPQGRCTGPDAPGLSHGPTPSAPQGGAQPADPDWPSTAVPKVPQP